VKRYLSVDQIYVEKLAELCGESYAAANSWNLIKCQELNRSGWQWKAIYFALIDYFSRMDKEWDDKFKEEEKEFVLNDSLRGQWLIGDTKEHEQILYDYLKVTTEYLYEYKTAEEFFFDWEKENRFR
jgi:hypothetical protein